VKGRGSASWVKAMWRLLCNSEIYHRSLLAWFGPTSRLSKLAAVISFPSHAQLPAMAL
jgi:hypothetical protein